MLPGSGLLVAGRRLLGLLLLLPLAAAGVIGWYARDPHRRARPRLRPGRLTVLTTVAVGVLLVWVASVVATTSWSVRGSGARRHGLLGSAFVLLMCLAVAAPLGLVARYSTVQKQAGAQGLRGQPHRDGAGGGDRGGPLGRPDRVNVLLLGGDGNVHREGVRTDSVVLASMDVRTGGPCCSACRAT